MGKVKQLGILMCMLLGIMANAQDKVKYKAEGTMEVFKRNGEKVQRLIDRVVFTQKTTTIYCDSAFFYRKSNSMEAFGRVRIVDDSVTITSRELYYDGNSRQAKLRKNVVYTKGFNRLTTDNLDYDMDAEISHYFGGGKLQDTTNTLTSNIGYFYAQQNYATFTKNVVLVAPNYTLKSQQLRYDTRTKIATTPAETEIITENGQTTLYADGGEFRTQLDQSLFVDGKVETPNNYLEGDDLFFDQKTKYYKAVGHVKLIAKDKDVIITGDEGYNDESRMLSKIYGNPVMKRIMENDTLYISADTLVYIESDIDSLKRILAYSNVKLFKSNLQGLSDSASYFLSDSLIYMYHDPILWSKNSQVEGDTIRIEIQKGTIHKMFLKRNAFLSSQDTILNFNQIKGRNMTARFFKGNIHEVDVNGNGEVIYYALAEGDSLTMGLNRILCSNLKLRFEKRNIKNISAYVKPEARFIPPHEFTDQLQKLDGFSWRGSLRPTLEQVLEGNSVNQNLIEKKPKPSKIEGTPVDLLPDLPDGLERPNNVKKRPPGGQ
jgi:lipopolysaccharide export system protein LptA